MRMIARDEDVPSPAGLGPIAPHLFGGLAAVLAASLVLYGVADTPVRLPAELAALAALALQGVAAWLTLSAPRKFGRLVALVAPAGQGVVLGGLAAVVLPGVAGGTPFLSAAIGWFVLVGLASAEGSRAPWSSAAVLAPVATGTLGGLALAGGSDLISVVVIAFGALAAVSVGWTLRRRRDAEDFTRLATEHRLQSAATSLLLDEAGNAAAHWVWQLDAAGTLVGASAGFETATGLSADLFGTLRFSDFLAELGAAPPAQVARIRADIAQGRAFRDVDLRIAGQAADCWWRLSGTPLRDESGRLLGYAGTTLDRTDALRTERDLETIAHADPLTRLFNRGQFGFELECLAERLERHGGAFALLLVDLDRLDPVEASLGRTAADDVLAEAGRRLRAALRPTDLAARLDGGRFAVLLPGLAHRGEVDTAAARVAKALSPAYRVAGQTLRVGLAQGIALAGADGSRPGQLLRAAEADLARTRQTARGGLKLVEPAAAPRSELAQAELPDALRLGRVELQFQPMLDVATGLPLALVAQPRWHHPQRGLLLPADFGPAAEADGALPALGDWMIGEACRVAATLPEGTRIALDIAPAHLATDLGKTTLAALKVHGVAGRRLEFMFGARALASLGADLPARLVELRRLGVAIAMTEFGAGVAIPERLLEFPFDRVAIGRPFITRLAADVAARRALRALAPFAVDVLVEGLETAEQVRLLAEIAGRDLTGMALAAPLREAGLARFLADDGPEPLRPLGGQDSRRLRRAA